MEAAVHPETRRHATPPVGAGQRRPVVVVVAGGLQALHQPDFLEHRPLNLAGTFLDGVVEAELYRVNAQLVAQLVHHLFHAESGLRRAGRAIGGGLGFVDHHVVAFHRAVLQLVAGEGAGCALHHGRAGVGAGLKGQLNLGGGDFAGAVCAHLDAHPAAGRGAAALEYLGAAHQNLDRRAGLAGQQRGHRLQVEGHLAAKPAADFHGGLRARRTRPRAGRRR